MWIIAAMLLSLIFSAHADVRFPELFYGNEYDYALKKTAQDIFVCPTDVEIEVFQKNGTGVVLLGSPSNTWSRRCVILLQKMCERYGVGVIRYIMPAEQQNFAQLAQNYLLKWNTSFANVSGNADLIEENTRCDAEAIEGVVLFVNKGMIVGAHVGWIEDAEDNDVTELDADLNQMYVYLQKLGSSPCPDHC